MKRLEPAPLNVSVKQGRDRPEKDIAPNGKQLAWLRRGIMAPGHKLPLFDRYGRHVSKQLIMACLRHKWAEPWFSNPLKPDWLVCRLTAEGLALAQNRLRLRGGQVRSNSHPKRHMAAEEPAH